MGKLSGLRKKFIPPQHPLPVTSAYEEQYSSAHHPYRKMSQNHGLFLLEHAPHQYHQYQIHCAASGSPPPVSQQMVISMRSTQKIAEKLFLKACI